MTKQNVIVAVIVCVFVFWAFHVISDFLTPNAQVAGLYLESKEGLIPRYGILFLDSSRVKLFSDSKQLGPLCTYEVHGNHINVIHACGVWHLVKNGDTYINGDMYSWPFVARPNPIKP